MFRIYFPAEPNKQKFGDWKIRLKGKWRGCFIYFLSGAEKWGEAG
jgi:hypothetical protein